MSTNDRLPENWRGTRRDPRLPDTELGLAEDDEYVVLFDWPELDAYIRAPRECWIELGGDSPIR